jgi:predicted dehydrogenase
MTIRIGLVGAGRRAIEVHAPALASCPDVEFAGVWARSPAPTEALAGKFGVPAHRRFDDLLEHCDALAFAVPPAVQAELGGLAAARGKALLLERPIAADIAGAEQLTLDAETSGVVTQLALAWRYAPAIRRFLRTDVPNFGPVGGTGRVICGPPGGTPPPSTLAAERGVLLTRGTDLVDLLDAALGPVAGVRAHGDRAGWIGLMLEHQIGHYSESSLYGGAPSGTDIAEAEVFGPAGALRIDCAEAVGPLTFERMYQEFAEAVTTGQPHELDVRRGLHLQRVIEGAETDLVAGT